LVYPDKQTLNESQNRADREPWGVRQDWQLRRNRAAFPRAWLVHGARVRTPARTRAERDELLQALLFMNDPLWSDREGPAFDLRAAAWIETDNPSAFKGSVLRDSNGMEEPQLPGATGPRHRTRG